MSKGFGKFLAGAIIAGAAAAGAYYLLKAKEDEDDFDDFDDDVNDDLEDFLKEETAGREEKSRREYVPLNFSKEAVNEVKKDIEKTAGTIKEEGPKIIGDVKSKIKSDVNVVKDAAKEASDASEFKFTDLTKDK